MNGDGSDLPHLVLVGLMATGKSTIGRMLAGDLGRPLLDIDARIESRTGRTVRSIFQDDGEAAFRIVERDALAEACAAVSPTVIACGGGVVVTPENRALLRGDGARVVWLRAAPETLLHRVRYSRAQHRPLLDGDPEGTLVRMHAERSPHYQEVADIIVDVEDRTPSQVADAVLHDLGWEAVGRADGRRGV